MDGPPLQQPEKQDEEPMVVVGSNGGQKRVSSYLKGTASSRIRTQSFDKQNSSMQQQQQHIPKPNISSRSANLDPTGMFRNRGRRVITTKSPSATDRTSAAAKSNHNVVTTASFSYSSTQQMNTTSSAQNNVNGQQRDQRAVQEFKQFIEEDGNESYAAMVENAHESDNIETNSTADEISMKQPPLNVATQSAATSDETAKECTNDDIAEENRAAKECTNNDDVTEENNHQNMKEGEIERIGDDDDDDGESDDVPIVERDHSINDKPFTCDDSAEFVPTITFESLKRFEFQYDNSANRSQSLYSNGRNIKQSLSKDSNDSEHSHSAIGSTVSIMGSLVGENEGTTIGSFGCDESKLLAVRRRMMQDVEEIAEMDMRSDSDADEIRDDEDDRPILYTVPLHDNPTVSESIESNAEVALRSEEEHAAESKTEVDNIVDVSDNVQTGGDVNSIKTARNIHEESPEASKIKVDNIVDVSDSVQTDGDVNNIKSATNNHGESPIRAALRRKTQNVAKSLPPLPSHLSALTPNRLHSSYAKTENVVASGLKVAQQCFSFEDTTVDDSNFLIMPDKLKSREDGGVRQPTHKYGLSGVASFASKDDGSPAEIRTPKRNSSDSTVAKNISEKPSKQSPMKKSAFRPKWYPAMSGGGTIRTPKVIRHRQVMDNKHSAIQVPATTGYDAIRLSSSFDPSPSSRRHSKAETDRKDAITFLQSIVMQSSHVEEDEKALHIPSLYCERCLSDHGNAPVVETSSMRHDNCPSCLEKMKTIANSIKRGVGAENDDHSESSNHEPNFDNQAQCAAIDLLVRSHEYAIQMKQSTLLAKRWLESIEEAESIGIIPSTANYVPMPVTEENLVTAERTLSTDLEINRLNSELSKCRAEIGRLKSLPREQEIPELTLNKSILSNSSSDDSAADGENSLNLTSPFPTTVKHCDSHDESYIRFEKRIEADMNLENRKEIIFLKAALEKANNKIAALESDSETCRDKKEPFKSEIEAIDASTTIEGTEDMIIQIAKGIENISVGSSSLAEEEEAQSNNPYSISLEDPRLEKELEEYRLALIESLRVKESSKSAPEPSTAESSNDENNVSNSVAAEVSSDERMVNVRMIDGENFTTEWSDLVEPLPPPPDHGLKSPIIDAILSKWTDDSNTQSALIKWMERILNGESSDNAPSLKLSGLDHQIRDGFIMHVLPLLLLRKDIHVHVTSRAHRQTTYDMAVSISQSVKGSTDIKSNRHVDRASGESIHRSKPGGRKHHLMAYQAAQSGAAVNSGSGSGEAEDSNIAPFSARQFLGRTAPDIVRTASHTESISTAVTAQISNRTSQTAKNLFRSQADGSYSAFSEMKTPDRNRMPSVPPPSLGDDLSVGSSVSEDNSKSPPQSSGIMGSLSGAFGGLLSRRKAPQSLSDLYHPLSSNKSISANSSSWSPSTLFTPQTNHTRSQEELRHDDIYHRVVSAPPGKIGLTFVEYEGNTMVSSVSDSSPLSGWVFPSDVLVAIDDTPVRDLRTRDIVQLLTEKKDQQRNLRMYSLNRR